MIPFLVIALAMLAIACAWVLVPLLSSRRAPTVDGEASNLAILREQRAELEADLANGVISQAQHDAARSELERRVLEDVTPGASPLPAQSRANAWTAALVGAGLPVAAVLLYATLGTPGALLVDDVHSGTAQAQGRTSPQEIDAMIDRVKERLAARPDDLEGWKVLARTYAALGRAQEAAAAYERASLLAPGDADVLADYADALALTQNRALEGRPEAIVARALRANPDQWKANVLAGTLAFQRGDFARAVEHWERVKAAVPAGSPVTQTIDASLAEARSRAKLASAVKPAGARITGIVALSPALAASVAPDDTVFVFARPVDGSRMPLALVRGRARELPLAFTLDDSTAMVADRKLSDHANVLVGARVSRSGQATPQPGDLEAELAAAKAGASGVEIVIDRKRP